MNLNIMKRFASFDYDWTMVKPKGKRKFPKDKGDWEFLFKSVLLN